MSSISLRFRVSPDLLDDAYVAFPYGVKREVREAWDIFPFCVAEGVVDGSSAQLLSK